jgi:hypothetical protein
MRRGTGKLILGIATLLGSVAGCSYEGHCPSDGCFNCSSNSRAEAIITVQRDAASVLSASADSPCSATFQGFAVLVSPPVNTTRAVHEPGPARGIEAGSRILNHTVQYVAWGLAAGNGRPNALHLRR